MPIPVRSTFSSSSPRYRIQVTDDGSRTLIRTDTGDSFHSGCGALTETRHVYLQGSGTAERLQTLGRASVLELGLGTAMAMLITVDNALKQNATLDYTAVETNWLPAALLSELRPESWTDDPTLVNRYCEFRNAISEPAAGGEYEWRLSERILVTICVNDFARWNPPKGKKFDAIYFDAFAPDSVPELWHQDSLRIAADCLKEDGQLATYSCSRPVRDAMTAVGLTPHRVPGPPGGKREVLVARKTVPSPQTPDAARSSRSEQH